MAKIRRAYVNNDSAVKYFSALERTVAYAPVPAAMAGGYRVCHLLRNYYTLTGGYTERGF